MPQKSAQPTVPPVPLPVWRELLDAALAFRAAEPWRWLYDRNVFALEDEQGRAWFSSVLGAAKQVFGLVLYRGEAGLRFLLGGSPETALHPDVAFAQDALMVDFGQKKALAPVDLEVLAELGYAPRPRARQAWPLFRSHVPGLFPWHLQESEARELTAGLRAAHACAHLALHQPAFFAPGSERPDLFPTVRMADALSGPLGPGQVTWRRWQCPPPPTPPSVFPPPNLAELLSLPLVPGSIMEFDVFHAFMPVSAPDRPYFPRLGLLVDGRTGFIYAVEIAPPALPWEELVRLVWLKALRHAGARPEHYHVQRPEWVTALAPLAAALGGKIGLKTQLPMVAEARESLDQFSQSRH